MELSHLKQFVAVAETENMTKAAEAMFLSQPNLSRTINNLEAELGVKLFDRNKGKLTLNSNGMKAYETAKQIFNEVEKLKNIAGRKTPPKIVIGGIGARYFDFIIPYLSKHVLDYEIKVNSVFSPQSCLQNLLDGKFDLIIGSKEFAAKCSDVTESRFLFTENLCIACPKNHKFAAQEKIMPNQLNGEHFVRSSNIESEVSNAFLKNHRIHTITDFQTDQPISGSKFVYDKALVFDTLLCRYFNNQKSKKAYIPVDSEDLRYDVYLLYRKEDRGRLTGIAEHIVNFFKIFDTNNTSSQTNPAI